MPLRKEYKSLASLNEEIQELGKSLLEDQSISNKMKKLILQEMKSNQLCLDMIKPNIEKDV
jgi:hypothetical protein